uniref:NK2 homeobox 2a n=1 Tax=Gasterosteus aculeatus aculeatus TaxID=481459 RepID=A0AAQ4QRV0_GASAC
MWTEGTVRAIPPRCVKLSVCLLQAGCPLHMSDLAEKHYLVDQRIVPKAGAATFPCIFPPHPNMSLTNTKTGFSVKDILDLPDTNDEDGSITGAEEDTEGSETTSTTKTTGVLVQSPLENVQNLPLKNPFYDSSENPYTRWLATTDSIQYSLHGLSASSQDSAKSPEPSADDESPDNDKETSSSGGSDSGYDCRVRSDVNIGVAARRWLNVPLFFLQGL